MALAIELLLPPPPRLMLMTLTAWFSAAKSIPSAMEKVSPNPSESRTLTGISAVPKASPAPPTALLVDSAITDATCVPWKLSSLAWVSLLMKSKPCTKTVAPKSGALRYGPKSS
jgi:hypothetical protein